MKYALQLYGVFRTFEKCIPDLLNYLNFANNIENFDVFILSEKIDGYSIANENKIKNLFKGRVKDFKYIEDYPSSIHKTEDKFFKNYLDCATEIRKLGWKDFTCNSFVTRLWYRRYLNNQQRCSSGQTYDWVIRTRFDIGYLPNQSQVKLDLLLKPPPPKTIYQMPDIFTCGSPEVVDYEANLINHWPYVFNYYTKNKTFPTNVGIPENPKERDLWIHKWLMMSESNLCSYIRSSPYHVIEIVWHLNIIRNYHINLIDITKPIKLISYDLGSKQITVNRVIKTVTYGINDHTIDITKAFINQCKPKNFLCAVSNNLANIDPKPGQIKKLTIIFTDGTQINVDEHQNFYLCLENI